MKKGTRAAFPMPASSYQTDHGGEWHGKQEGMSTRLYLAGMAMQGILASMACRITATIEIDIELALKCADELLKQEEESQRKLT